MKNQQNTNGGLRYAAFVEGEFLSKKEAAKLAGSSVRSIERQISKRRLKKYKLGTSVRIRRSELLQLMGVNLQTENYAS